MFDVVPVIDVRNGVAVRAVAGDRANYKPLVTPLCATSDPRAVATGLIALHPFPVIYLADLDSIEGRRGGGMDLANKILAIHPGFELWADCGCREKVGVEAFLTMERVRVIIGSETGITQAEMSGLTARFGDEVILSLDYREDRFVGDPELLANPACWPSRVIAMTLANVGTATGPDLARITDIKSRAPDHNIFAAGGVRDRADLSAARAAGAAGALISSALHAQTITAGDLVEITGRKG